jgi:hypothetical protein
LLLATWLRLRLLPSNPVTLSYPRPRPKPLCLALALVTAFGTGGWAGVGTAQAAEFPPAAKDRGSPSTVNTRQTWQLNDIEPLNR